MLSSSLYLFLFYTEAAFIKKIQARGGQCWGKITRKRGKGEREKRKRQGEDKGKHKKNKAAFGLPY